MMEKSDSKRVPFEQYIEHAQSRLEEMQQRAQKLPEAQSTLTMEALEEVSGMLEELNVAGEELHVTQEELRQRNQELVTTRTAVEAERQRYQALFELAPDGYLVTDPQGVIQEANQAAAEMLNLPSGTLVRKPLFLFVSKDEQAQLRSYVNRLAHGQYAQVENLGLLLKPRQENPLYATVTISAIQDTEGQVTGLRWLIRDVTAQREMEAERERLVDKVAQDRASIQALAVRLEQERDVLQTVMENTHAHLAYFDSEFNFVRVNAAYAEGAGYTPEELIGRNHFELFPHPENKRIFRQVVESGEPITFYARPFEYINQLERGTTYWDWRLAPVKDEEGTIRGLVFSLLDVTEHEHTRQALSRYTQRLQALHEADREILAARSIKQVAQAVLPYVVDLIPCQHASVALFDQDEDRISLVAGTSLGENHPRAGWRGRFSELPHQVRHTLTQGEVHLSEEQHDHENATSLVAALHQAGLPSVINIPLCIQDKLIGSLNLGLTSTGQLTIEHMEIAREIGAQLAIGIRQMRLHQQVRQHARTLERLVARRTASLEASEARFRAIFEQSAVGIALVNLRGYAILTNARLQEMLGYSEEELYEIRFPQITHPEDRQRDQELFEELLSGARQEYVMEKRYIRQDRTMIWGRLTVSIVRSLREAPRFVIAIIEDITAERERQRALIQAEKLATAGKLAASLAHEINNPLQSVIGCLGLAEEVMDEGEDASRYVEIALEELRRAASIVARLRDVQRAPGPGTRKPTDINALIDQVLTLTHKECETHGIEVRWETSERIPALLTAPDRIKQVFLNLMLNAVDAMAEGGELHIEAVETEEPSGVRITFSDTGPGIPPDVLPHIFDTFYTTKDKGMGMGLFISQDIIKQHGGTLKARSELGRGAEFEVWLPLESAAGNG